MDFTATLPGRVDAFLAAQGAVRSRGQAQKLIEAGAVKIEGKIPKKPSNWVWPGQKITLDEAMVAEERASHLPAVDLKLEVLYEDAACIVINKPAGVVVHPAVGVAKAEPTILHGAAHLFAERGLPFSEDGVLVHRLDRETSGCLLLAKTPEAHAALQKQFADRTVKKTYLALVAGIPERREAVIDAPIGRHSAERTKMTVWHAQRTREAQTSYRVLADAKDCALLACDLHTGRTHQIRVHLHAIGHPVLGDDTYITDTSVDVARKHGISDLCLHSWKLSFDSPVGKNVSTTANAAPTFCAAAEKVGISLADID